MSHRLSLALYHDVKLDATVEPKAYRDLESLVRYLEVLKVGQNGVRKRTRPGRFGPLSPAPTLLIVEDEAPVSQMVTSLLVKQGYPSEAIKVFSSGDEAIYFASRQAVGIALVDIRLASALAIREVYTSGLRVLQGIKEASPAAKVVLISGFGTYEMVREAILSSGASYYLGKPFSVEDVLGIVHWAVESLLGEDVVRALSAGETTTGEAPTAGRRQERILIVDDDAAVSEGVALALRTIGYAASAVPGGGEALRRLADERFDAVLLDVRMPDMDGVEVLARLRQAHRDVAVILLTAVDDENIAREAMRLGAHDFLTKPCDLKLLQLTLEYAFAQRDSGGGHRGG
ncbi:MAG: response regulator [Candidatus Latescibacteria bacterium]|jgi:DNA-binding NtrC family response regulator|nr:response regulator [Candidatus Latescibacterota bacterium]